MLGKATENRGFLQQKHKVSWNFCPKEITIQRSKKENKIKFFRKILTLEAKKNISSSYSDKDYIFQTPSQPALGLFVEYDVINKLLIN